MTDASRSPVEAIDRALVLLTHLSRMGPGGAPLADLVAATGLNKSTAYRALAALRARDFVVQDDTGAYALGPAATGLGEAHFGNRNLAALVQPALFALSRETDELCHLGVLESGKVVYLDKVEPDRAIRVWSRVGEPVPAAPTALGRALLAFRPTRRDQLTAFTSDSDTSPDRLWEALELARRRGFASEYMENEPGIACAAFPLLLSGVAIAAISITAPAERMSDARMSALAAVVRRIVPPLLPDGLSLPGAET